MAESDRLNHCQTRNPWFHKSRIAMITSSYAVGDVEVFGKKLMYDIQRDHVHMDMCALVCLHVCVCVCMPCVVFFDRSLVNDFEHTNKNIQVCCQVSG